MGSTTDKSVDADQSSMVCPGLDPKVSSTPTGAPDWYVASYARNAGLRGRAILTNNGRTLIGLTLEDVNAELRESDEEAVVEGYLIELPGDGRCYIVEEHIVVEYLSSFNLIDWTPTYDFEIIEDYGALVELTNAQKAWTRQQVLDNAPPDGI